MPMFAQLPYPLLEGVQGTWLDTGAGGRQLAGSTAEAALRKEVGRPSREVRRLSNEAGRDTSAGAGSGCALPCAAAQTALGCEGGAAEGPLGRCLQLDAGHCPAQQPVGMQYMET